MPPLWLRPYEKEAFPQQVRKDFAAADLAVRRKRLEIHHLRTTLQRGATAIKKKWRCPLRIDSYREVMIMKQEALNQGWQQLQAHIEGLLGRTLGSDVQKIEYKPRFILHLLEMPPETQQNNIEALHSKLRKASIL
jgi:hypothetical protein